MDQIDLPGLRDQFNRGRILLCFNGPISRSLIEEIGNALKNYLRAEQATEASAATDVFGVYIELTQNIRHYAVSRGYDESEGSATVVVARDGNGHYVVQAGNLVERDDGDALRGRIDALAQMDKAQLKAAYKEQLRRPREAAAASGAGLGLIDVSRKAAAPLKASFSETGDNRYFFSLCATI